MAEIARRVSLGVVICVTWASAARPAWASPPQPDLKVGKAAYDQSCARCHGDAGHGDGVDAKRFYPRPRDFSLGVYKFRSTASGTPPSDADLFETITRGLPGSNMPDWSHLDEAVRWQLVYYLKSLSSKFQGTPPSPVDVAPDPGPKGADLAKGKALYAQLGCAACHGAQGRANGTSAAGLVDDWGMAIRPANLTQGWSYRGGNDPRSIMLRVLAGIDGAGMPSYAGALSPADAWQLAYYVSSLQEPAHWNMIAHASWIDGPLPTALDDPRWASVESTDVRVRNAVTPSGEWAAPPTVKSVRCQIVYNQEAAAFKFSWDDPSHSVQSLPDGFALVLKPERVSGDVVTLQDWPYSGASRLDFCYWSAETDKATEQLASDFDSVLAPTGSRAALVTTSNYTDGRWSLMLQRPLKPTSPPGAGVITPEVSASIAVTVWDGGNPNARAISPWIDVVLGNGHATTKK